MSTVLAERAALPAMGSATRRPRGPGAPSRVSTTRTPATRPSPTIATGWRLNRKRTPSSRLFL